MNASQRKMRPAASLPAPLWSRIVHGTWRFWLSDGLVLLVPPIVGILMLSRTSDSEMATDRMSVAEGVVLSTIT